MAMKSRGLEKQWILKRVEWARGRFFFTTGPFSFKHERDLEKDD